MWLWRQAIASRFALGQHKAFPDTLPAMRLNVTVSMPLVFDSEACNWFQTHKDWDCDASANAGGSDPPVCNCTNLYMALDEAYLPAIARVSGSAIQEVAAYKLAFSPVSQVLLLMMSIVASLCCCC